MDRPRVLIPHQVEAEIARDLQTEIRQRLDADVSVSTTEEDTANAIEDINIVVTYGFDRAWLERANALEWIQVLSAGYDHFDLEYLESRGITVTNASGIHAEPMSQQVLCYLFLFERDILGDIHRQANNEWHRHWGEEIRDKTVGIAGVGAIGGRVAAYLDTFGAETIGTKRDPSSGGEAVDALYGPEDVDTVLERADYLVITCPLTEETRGLIGVRELDTLHEEAVVINVARGQIIQESALIEALQSGELGGAALDVFEEEPLPEDSPLWGMDNVVITPHTAGTSQLLNQRKARLFAENYEAFRADEPLRNQII